MNIFYVVLFRGINVGGNKKVSMLELKKMLEGMGFEKVKTILNSGNVILEGKKMKTEKMELEIESAFEKKFGFESSTIVRTQAEIQDLITADPFSKIKVTKETRLYVTFLKTPKKSSLKIPYETKEKDFKILRATDGEVCSVLTLSPTRKSTEAMNILEKEYRKQVTTRNWNTVLKLSGM